MANLGQVFDSNQYSDPDKFDPIPRGWYNFAVTKSSIEVNSKKTGKYISIENTVLDGEYKGRKVWINLNHINPNPQTVEIALKLFGSLCRAANKKTVADTQELHGIPVQGKVKIVPAKGDWPAKNDIIIYKAIKNEIEVPDFAKTNAKETKRELKEELNTKTGGVPWD